MSKQFQYPPSVLEGDNYSYLEREWRAPAVDEDDEIVFDEPGRVLPPSKAQCQIGGIMQHGTDCRSHYFRVTRPDPNKFSGKFRLWVQHGSGTESWDLDYDRRTVEALRELDSDSRYRILWVIMYAHKTSFEAGAYQAADRYRTAFVEGRLKKRKVRGSEACKVWIEAN